MLQLTLFTPVHAATACASPLSGVQVAASTVAVTACEAHVEALERRMAAAEVAHRHALEQMHQRVAQLERMCGASAGAAAAAEASPASAAAAPASHVHGNFQSHQPYPSHSQPQSPAAQPLGSPPLHPQSAQQHHRPFSPQLHASASPARSPAPSPLFGSPSDSLDHSAAPPQELVPTALPPVVASYVASLVIAQSTAVEGRLQARVGALVEEVHAAQAAQAAQAQAALHAAHEASLEREQSVAAAAAAAAAATHAQRASRSPTPHQKQQEQESLAAVETRFHVALSRWLETLESQRASFAESLAEHEARTAGLGAQVEQLERETAATTLKHQAEQHVLIQELGGVKSTLDRAMQVQLQTQAQAQAQCASHGQAQSDAAAAAAAAVAASRAEWQARVGKLETSVAALGAEVAHLAGESAANSNAKAGWEARVAGKYDAAVAALGAQVTQLADEVQAATAAATEASATSARLGNDLLARGREAQRRGEDALARAVEALRAEAAAQAASVERTCAQVGAQCGGAHTSLDTTLSALSAQVGTLERQCAQVGSQCSGAHAALDTSLAALEKRLDGDRARLAKKMDHKLTMLASSMLACEDRLDGAGGGGGGGGGGGAQPFSSSSSSSACAEQLAQLVDERVESLLLAPRGELERREQRLLDKVQAASDRKVRALGRVGGTAGGMAPMMAKVKLL